MKQDSIKGNGFDAATEAEKLKELCRIRQRRRYRRSRLTDHRAELVELAKAGLSMAQLQLWLRLNKRMKVARSTIWRFLRQLPEWREV